MKNTWWIILLCCFNPLFGQSWSETQKWGDYTLNYPFASSYNLKYNGAYKTTTWDGEWKSIENSLSVERRFGSRVTVTFSGLAAYNVQTEDYKTLELRPSLGVKYYFNPKMRFPFTFYTRYESRHVKNLEDDIWTQTHRLRFRPELKIPINGKWFTENKLWYGILEAELFANLGEQEEFFANRFRASAGIGYRANEAWRFELVYVWQLSKNTIGDDFNGAYNIFRIRVKNYLSKSAKSKRSD